MINKIHIRTTHTDESVSFIGGYKDSLVSQMIRFFSFYFTPYQNIFDEFYEYLENSVRTGDICQLEEQLTKVLKSVI